MCYLIITEVKTMIDIRLTKTEFMNGMRCGKMVWLDNHHPEYKKLAPEVKELFARGHEFGDKAMGMFGEYEEMSAYFEDGHIDCGTMIKRTKQAIKKGTRVICEAAFTRDGLYCAMDILRLDDGCDPADPTYTMYEVKDVPEVEPWFIMDAAFQYYVASKTIKIRKVYIVTHGENDTYETTKVTRLVEATQKGMPVLIDHVKAAITTSEAVATPYGKDCEEPYRCPYWDYCHNIDI